MDPKGRVYTRCLWKPPGAPKACGEFLLKPSQIWDHVVKTHLRVPQREEDGRFSLAAGAGGDVTPMQTQTQTYHCHWAGCRHFVGTGGSSSPYEVAVHIKTHLPDSSDKASLRLGHNRSLVAAASSSRSETATTTATAGRSLLSVAGANGHVDTGGDDMEVDVDERDLGGREAQYLSQSWLSTAVDERGDAAGLPLTSVLVLRNLARNVVKVSGSVAPAYVDVGGRGEDATRSAVVMGGVEKREGEGEGWMERLFGGVRGGLWFVMANNRMLAGYVADLMGVVETGGGGV